MEYLNRKIIECQGCKLHQTRKYAIPGEGPAPSGLMIIAQSPGITEDINNRLLIGPSGRIFNQLMKTAGLSRDYFYLTNLIKCMLPKSRRPSKDEIHSCTQFLSEEINMVQPRILVPLGFHATRYLFKEYHLDFPPKAEVYGVFGKVFHVHDMIIYPVRHPAALLFNPDKKAEMERNYSGIRTLMARYCNSG